MDIDVQDTGSAAASTAPDQRTRRRLLGAGALGLAGSLLPQLMGRASATTPPDSSEAATTTTAPPRRPAGDDEALLQFAQTAELAAVALYDTALAAGSLDEAGTALVGLIRQAHLESAQVIAALIGKTAPGIANDAVLAAFAEAFGGSDDEILAAAYDLESTLVATHGDLIGLLEGTDGSALIASILMAEARHETVLADLAGGSDLDRLLHSNATALEPTKG